MAKTRIYKKRPFKKRPASKKPKSLAKKVSYLMKQVKLQKPEMKYFDYTLANEITMGEDNPYQIALLYPSQGNDQGFRIGDKIQNVRVHFKGQIWTDTNNVSGGKVHIYALQQLDNTSSNYVSGNGSFIQQDIRGNYTPASFRNFEDLPKWKILTHKVFTIKANGVQDAATNNQIGFANVDFTLKIPDPDFNSGLLLTDINNHIVQLYCICDWGWTSGGFPVASYAQSGYRMSLQQRMMYYDN